MKHKRLILNLVFFLTFVCLPAAVAQTPASSLPQVPVLSTRTTLVLVPALVRTKDGAPVFTLTAKDFVLTDDGIEQKITIDEETGSEPLALVVVVETGGAGARQLDKYRNLGASIEAVIGGVRHEVAVVEFDSEARLALAFTPDLNAVGETLRGLEPGDRGAAILDGLRFSVDLLRRQPPSYRRAILLISETVDHGSKANLEQALHDVSDTNTAIYSLNFSSAKSAAKNEASQILSSSKPGPAGGCMSRGPDVDPSESRLEQAYDCLSLLAPPLRAAKAAALLAADGLKHNAAESVAQLTGGESFSFKDARSLERDVQAISHHLPNRYLLSFYPAAPHAGFHAIGLRLTEYPNLVVTGRNGYWADEVTSAGNGPG
jgi:VWFA-related protein